MSLTASTATGAPRRTATVPDVTGAYSVFARIRLAGLTTWGALVSMGDAGTNQNLVQLSGSTANLVAVGNTLSSTILALSLSVWYDIAFTYSGVSGGAGSLIGYARRSGTTDAWSSASCQGVDINQFQTPGLYIGAGTGGELMNGDRCDAMCWAGVVLTPAELEIVAGRRLPTRWESLWGWWPFHQASDLKDYSGNGRDMVLGGGTATDGPAPPVRWGPQRRRIAFVPTGGGSPPARTGDGAARLALPRVAGAGTLVVAAAGALRATLPRPTAAGALTISGTGGGRAAPLRAAAAGVLVVSGPGMVRPSPVRVVSAGAVGVTGAGAARGGVRVAAAGAIATTGSGVLRLPLLRVAGSGSSTQLVVGAGALVLATPRASGVGMLAVAGAAAVPIPAARAAAAGALSLVGAGVVRLVPRGAAAVAVIPLAGGGVLRIPLVRLAGVGLVGAAAEFVGGGLEATLAAYPRVRALPTAYPRVIAALVTYPRLAATLVLNGVPTMSPLPTPVRAGASNVLELQQLRDVLAAAGVMINDATVQVQIVEYLTGTEVLPATDVPTTNAGGTYRVTLPKTIAFRAGVRYLATVTATANVGAETLDYLEELDLVGATQ